MILLIYCVRTSNNANDAADFECNICFELAQDPVVTLCSHLFWARAATAPPPPEANPFAFGLTEGFVPMATTRIGNFTMGFGGLLPSLFNIHFHGFPDATVYGTTSGFPSRFNMVHGGHTQGFPQQRTRGQQADNVPKNILLLIGVFVILALLY
ncbi:hypothetical protein V6N12_010187 [Hibiscus sabdariffa]|uniref:E3 ubiquitin-protein ligase RMA n=1 Tax=Hibiscus sabdariffa TaxID=183260 RepID=A0ABR2ATP7_9ROSI